MARRQQSAGGMDIMGVITNVPLAITFLFAIVGWWCAFIGQIVYENKYDQSTNVRGSAVGVSWFSIFLQLAVIVMLFLVLARGTLEIYRFQLTAFISILVVFSVIGTNQGIFGAISSQLAIGAGWLLLAVSNILWLLFITADDETRLALVLSSYAGDVPPNRTRSMMRQSRRTSSALGISNNQGSVTDLHSQHTHTVGGPVGTYGGNNNGSMNGGMGTYGSGGPGYGLNGGSMGGKGMGMNNNNGSVHSLQSSGVPQGYAPSPTMGSMAGGQMAPSSRSGTPLGGGPQSQPKLSNGPTVGGQSMPPQSMTSTLPSTMPSSQATQVPAPQQQGPTATPGGAAGAAPAAAGTNPNNLTPPFKMKASFSYSASPDDPNEISFVKGEILTILDNSGKWFNAQKMDGSEGIVPSNYLTFIDA